MIEDIPTPRPKLNFSELADGLIKQIIEIENNETAYMGYQFMKETGLKPSEVMLVKQQTEDGVKFWYERKGT